MQEEKLKREASRITVNKSGVGINQTSLNDTSKQLNRSMTRQETKGALTKTNPIKFQGKLGSNKVLEQTEQKTFSLEDELNRLSQQATHQLYSRTQLPQIPVTHVGRQSLQKIQNSLQLFLPREPHQALRRLQTSMKELPARAPKQMSLLLDEKTAALMNTRNNKNN